MSRLRFRYQTIEFGSTDVHLRSLRDLQQYADDSGIAGKLGISSANWPLFGVIWDSSRVLAHFMADYEIDGKRILEVGCGMALSSLLLNQRSADITATDYHPEVEAFLIKNTQLNHGDTIPFVRTDWRDEQSQLGQFDLIIGSDLLYEKEHIELLSNFIQQHSHQDCEVIIVDPGRGQHAQFSKSMVKLGYSHSQDYPADTGYLERPFKGHILRFHRETVLEKH